VVKERRRKDKRGLDEGSEGEVREKAPLLTRELAIREALLCCELSTAPASPISFWNLGRE
jgi:hypothetical protein